ncbi:MAG: hypothetical protein U0W24_05525 [Bacteroidales bacterium]
MRQKIYFILTILFLAIFGCKRETEMFSFFRPSNPQNFKNVRGGELYTFAANDSVTVRADYYMKVLGQLKTYGDEILQYGFVWHPTNARPVITVDTLMTKNGSADPPLPGANDTLSFNMPLTRLLPDTKYFIRSYVIRGDGNGNPVDTGYNPVVLERSTESAIDEWFMQEGGEVPESGFRFDAVAFNFGDTIFFGTGDQGQNILTKDIYMYDPTKGTWEFWTSLANVYLPVSQQFRDKVTDAVGFALQYTDNITKQKVKCIYVGLGDYVGNDLRDDKSNVLLEYNMETKNYKTTSQSSGGIRSGSVCFVIGEKAYIGTGSNSNPTHDWHVFQPANEWDGDITTFPWLQISSPDEVNRTGAVAFAINGRGYFGLGKKEDGTFLKDFWEFRPNESDPTLGTWIKKADFPGTPRANASAFVIGDQGYVGTGDNITGDMESDPPTYSGELFEDVYRYDPFNNKWFKVRDYTSNKTDRLNISKKVTRGVGFSIQKDNVGFIGFGIVPTADPRAQEDLWKYQPFITSGK